MYKALPPSAAKAQSPRESRKESGKGEGTVETLMKEKDKAVDDGRT